MGKSKKGIADKVREAKNSKAKNVFKVQSNPFEVKINRQKHSILGRKTKHDRGLPGVSRSKANKKRKDTILKEYKDRFKTNNVSDGRFGENGAEISVEDKMLQRFAMEKKKKHEKMSMFNLNDEEELTHFGRSLADIEDFGTNAPSDDEDTGVISGEYVSEAHFGGGIFTKKDSNAEESSEQEKPKSRKEIIDEIILKSKKAKFEKQTAQEETNNLREKLDSTWQEVEKLLKSSARTTKDKEEAKDSYKLDDYDVAVKQMQYDKKAAPAARGQTEAEKAAEEAAKLRKYEEERIQRMQPNYNGKTKKLSHRSADELNFDFLPEKLYIDPVQYKDGVMVGTEEPASNTEEDGWQLEPVIDNDGNDDEEQTNSEDGSDDNSEDDDDDFSDIMSNDGGDAGSEEQLSDNDDFDIEIDSGTASLDKEGLKALKEKAVKFPTTYEEFSILLELKYGGDCETCIASLRNKFPPSAAKGNKDRLQKLFEHTWKRIHNMCLKEEPLIKNIDSLVSHLFELCRLNSVPNAKFVLEELKNSYSKHFSQSKKISTPNFANIIQFKLIKILFSTSDFTHPICTPAMVFMSQIIHSCHPTNLKDLSSYLSVCTLCYEYVCFSKRFIPECINFLCAALCLAVPKPLQQAKGIPACASSHINSKNCELLVVKSNSSDVGLDKPNLLQLINSKLPDSLDTDDNRLQLLRLTLRLILKFVRLYGQLPCFKEIFDPIKITCSRVLLGYKKLNNGKQHPLAHLLTEIQTEIQRLVKKRPAISPLVQTESNKPKALPLYDPKIEEICEPFQKASRKQTSAAKRERERLQHKYKRELKGAVREIKKDARFIAREQLNEQIEKDQERAAKVKRLFGFLSNQEGEVKKINRKTFKLDLS